ncbi:hypothetical protein BDN67DRAFT_984985 [Paxillus ammoniavirescens]|nr:hypothetical protein BDN67DRAFT_984985 [Paxillus ammoniavirescens]
MSDISMDVVPNAVQNGRSTIKIAKPAAFNGDKSKFESWFRHVQMYFQFQDVQPTERNKILLTMSYMSEGYASEWSASYFDREEQKNVLQNPYSWRVFKTQLEHSFGPINNRQDTQERLVNFKQGKLPINKYLTKWEQILTTARYGLITDDTNEVDSLIRLLHSNCREAIVQGVEDEVGMIHSHSYVTWVAHLKERGKIIKSHPDKTSTASQKPPYYNPASRPLPNPSAPLARPDADCRNLTGVTFGGHGQLMDLDCQHAQAQGLCYKCSQPGTLPGIVLMLPLTPKEFVRCMKS